MAVLSAGMLRALPSSASRTTAGAQATALAVCGGKPHSSSASEGVAFSPSRKNKCRTHSQDSNGSCLKSSIQAARAFKSNNRTAVMCNPKGFAASTEEASSEIKPEANADEVLEQLSNGMVPGAEMIVSLLEKAYAEESLGEEV